MSKVADVVVWADSGLDICPNRANLKDWDKKTWCNSFHWDVVVRFRNGKAMRFTIPEHTDSDGSSTPFGINALIPAIGPNFVPAMVHDYICRNPHISLTCGQADDIYLILARKYGEYGRLAHLGLRLYNFITVSNPNYKERKND